MFPVLSTGVVFRTLQYLMVTVELELLSLQQRIFIKSWPKNSPSVSFKESKRTMIKVHSSYEEKNDFHAQKAISICSMKKCG